MQAEVIGSDNEKGAAHSGEAAHDALRVHGELVAAPGHDR
jgi:hypothetical protein